VVVSLSAQPRLGTVREFDEARGLGTVVDDDGNELGFHCTSIADGTRTIVPGTPVTFCVVAGRAGRMEARGIVGLGSPA